MSFRAKVDSIIGCPAVPQNKKYGNMFTAANEPYCLQLTKNDIGKPSWIQNAKIYLWKED